MLETSALKLFIVANLHNQPSWFVSSVGRMLQRHRRGHGFKFLTGLNFFFQALFSLLHKQCSLLRRLPSYSHLYLQFKYLTFIYLQSFIINSVNYTKLPCYTLPLMQHHSFFRSVPLFSHGIHCLN